jgi:hypothetical protein
MERTVFLVGKVHLFVHYHSSRCVGKTVMDAGWLVSLSQVVQVPQGCLLGTGDQCGCTTDLLERL